MAAVYSNELRKLAKAMNQRMLELEKRGMNSPAYQSIQARLAAMGRPKNKKGVYRFSETGKFKNKNEMTQYKAMLERFKAQETSKISGYKQYRKSVLEGLQERYDYEAMGLSDDDVLAFWEAMPDNERDRIYGSDETFIIVAAYTRNVKAGKIRNDNALSMKELVERINSSKSLTQALDKLGIDMRQYMDFKQGVINNLGGF